MAQCSNAASVPKSLSLFNYYQRVLLDVMPATEREKLLLEERAVLVQKIIDQERDIESKDAQIKIQRQRRDEVEALYIALLEKTCDVKK